MRIEITTIYIISQVFVLLYYVLFAVSFTLKNRKLILFVTLASLFANGVAYALLSAWAGFAMNFIAILRNLIFIFQYKYSKNADSEKYTKSDWIILSVLTILSVVLGIVSWTEFYSIFAMAATMTYTLAVWFKNVKTYRFLGLIVSMFGITYNAFVHSILGVILEGIVLIVNTIVIIKVYIVKKNGDIQVKNSEAGEQVEIDGGENGIS